MSYPIFIIDAFTTHQFAGNQAAVCLTTENLTTEECQRIAAEFNLSETAFPYPIKEEETFVNGSSFNLRWFTPTVEAPMCGHATLATAHVLFNEIGNTNPSIDFHTKVGVVTVKKNISGIEMDFPALDITSPQIENFKDSNSGIFPLFDAPQNLFDLIRSVIPENIGIRSIAYAKVSETWQDIIVVIDEEISKDELLSISPDYNQMMALGGSNIRGVIVTLAPKRPFEQGFIDDQKNPYDYVLRYFGPWVGIREDPATGSAQCGLAPFWSKVLGKKDLYVFQCYPNRGAQFRVTVHDQSKTGRVSIIGSTVSVVKGEMKVNHKKKE